MKLGISSRLCLTLRPVQIDKNDSATFLTESVNYSSTEAISAPLGIVCQWCTIRAEDCLTCHNRYVGSWSHDLGICYACTERDFELIEIQLMSVNRRYNTWLFPQSLSQQHGR